MENNDSPVTDYRRKSGINLARMIICILLTYVLVSQIANFVKDIKTAVEQEKAQEELLILTEEKNNQINLITDLEDEYSITNNQYIEFEYGIKIPMPNKLMDKDNIISCKEIIETNNIAYRSRAVKINYGPKEATASLILDIFSERLPEDYNYEKVLYYFDDGTEIYTRDEEEGYFSYIIFKEAEVTYGVCYGKPELRIY